MSRRSDLHSVTFRAPPPAAACCGRITRLARAGWAKAGIVASAGVVVVAGVVLWRMLRDLNAGQVAAAAARRDVRGATLFVALGYLTLTFYDLFALRTVGRRDVPWRTAALASFTSYAVGHNLGASAVTGGAVRWRIYSARGLGVVEVAKVCFIAGLTFWLGNATVLGAGIALVPEAASALDGLPPSANRMVALALLAALAVYVAWVWRAPRTLAWRDLAVRLPGGPMTLAQIGLGIVDLGCCAAAMYTLLPADPDIGFVTLAVIFVSATLLGFASHSPGGLGVFDVAMLTGLWQFGREDLVAGLLLFRLLYYLVPFALAVAVLGGRELTLAALPSSRASPSSSCHHRVMDRWVNRVRRDALCQVVPGSPAVKTDPAKRPPAHTHPTKRDPVTIKGYQPESGLAGSAIASAVHLTSRARVVLLAAALVFAALHAAGAVAALPALTGFVVVAAAVLFREAGLLAASGEKTPHAERLIPGLVDRTVEAVVSDLPDPTIVLTLDSAVVAFNESSHDITPGIKYGEPISFALRVPNVLEAIRAVAAGHEPRRIEFSVRLPTERWWEATIAPLTLPAPAGASRDLILLALRELTPLKRVEEMRADFVANASHELRTPLASLSGFIETLQGPARNDVTSRDRFLSIMKEQATRMARLIDDLLSLSRIEQKAHIHPDSFINLVQIVREVTDSLLPLAEERDVRIEIVDRAGELEVHGERDELIRVFENLIENALKYGASGKHVDITLSREPAHDPRDAVVSVRDYGPGIPPEHLPRLTERFYRVDIGESRAQGGTGLGLALVKHILNRHRGRLAIDSTPGAGASFTVRIPLRRAAAMRQQAAVPHV